MPRPVKVPRWYTKELSALTRVQRVLEADGRLNDEQLTRAIMSLNTVAALMQGAQGQAAPIKTR